MILGLAFAHTHTHTHTVFCAPTHVTGTGMKNACVSVSSADCLTLSVFGRALRASAAWKAVEALTTVEGKQLATPESDVYMFGSLIYELITGMCFTGASTCGVN